MKRRIYSLITAILMVLTACGSGQTRAESGAGIGHEISEPVAEVGKTESGTKETGQNAEPAHHEYEKMTVSYSEPMYGFSFRKDMEKTQTDYAAYYFETSIKEQERNACIEATDRMLSCIDAPQPEIEVAVLSQEFYDGVFIFGNRLYLSPQHWEAADYLAKVLLAGYGEWGNYGLAYGYADYLCKKAGLDGGEIDGDNQKAEALLPMSAPELYDLNLLCFDKKFVSSKDVEASKNNACLFVEDYLFSHSEAEFLELLSASGTVEGMAQTKEALEMFYGENGIEASLTEIRYQFGGVALDYGAACKYASFYIEKDWQDRFWKANPMVSENFLHEDYREVRKFFECNEGQMLEYQKLFGFDSYRNDIPITLANGKGMTGSSVFHVGYGVDNYDIHLLNVSSLMHEYIHSLMCGRYDDWSTLWKTEGFARYYSYKYDAYAYDFLNNDWNSSPIIWVREYIDFLGRPIEVRTDVPELWDILVHGCGFTDPNSSYESGASFIGYLSDQYGEQAVIAYICSDNEYNADWNLKE